MGSESWWAGSTTQGPEGASCLGPVVLGIAWLMTVVSTTEPGLAAYKGCAYTIFLMLPFWTEYYYFQELISPTVLHVFPNTAISMKWHVFSDFFTAKASNLLIHKTANHTLTSKSEIQVHCLSQISMGESETNLYVI